MLGRRLPESPLELRGQTRDAFCEEKNLSPRRPLRSRLEKMENTGVQENYTSPPSHSSHLEPWISEEGVGSTPKEFCPAFGIFMTK